MGLQENSLRFYGSNFAILTIIKEKTCHILILFKKNKFGHFEYNKINFYRYSKRTNYYYI